MCVWHVCVACVCAEVRSDRERVGASACVSVLERGRGCVRVKNECGNSLYLVELV